MSDFESRQRRHLADRVARTWAAMLLRGGKSMMSAEERTASSDATAMAEMMARSTEPPPPDRDQIAKFVDDLSARIMKLLYEGRGQFATLHVDYGPTAELAEAAKVAGISARRFPWKTVVHVDRDRMLVHSRHCYERDSSVFSKHLYGPDDAQSGWVVSPMGVEAPDIAAELAPRYRGLLMVQRLHELPPTRWPYQATTEATN